MPVKTVSEHRGLGFEGEQRDIGKGSQPSFYNKVLLSFYYCEQSLKNKNKNV